MVHYGGHPHLSGPALQMNPYVPLLSHAPPSIVRISPVMKPAPGDTRNATESAISSALPHRWSGTISVIRSTASGESHNCFAAPADSTGPGATALTRIRCCAHSTASVRVIDITPAFAAAEWIVPALPVQT